MRVLKIIPDIENIKTHLSTISGTIAYLLVMTLLGVAFVLMMAFSYMAGNILEFYDYIFKGKFTSRPPSYLIQYYRLVRYGIKKLLKKLYGLKSHLRLPS